MNNPLSRRAVLRGLGTVVSLPLLDAMTPAFASAPKKMPTRMAFVFVPNGMSMPQWRPGAAGKLGALPELLTPLSPIKDRLTVISGLAQQHAEANGDGPGDHARSAAAWLTGVQPRKTSGADIRNGISADQLAAQHIGKNTRFGSLEIGCERGGQNGDCDSGYSCAYSSNIAWRTEAMPVAKEVNPRLVFERLFGDGSGDSVEAIAKRNMFKRSILDVVLEDASVLRRKLGNRDQQKLDEYLTGVREIETRLARMEQSNQASILNGTKIPNGVPATYDEHIRLMGDMMILAFQADLTRISTFMFANEGSNRSYELAGVSEGHHEVSHHGKDAHKLEMKLKIDRFHMAQLGYILNKMNTIQEGNGTLLDNSMILFGAGISDGDRHNHDDLPILLAGRAGGSIRGGQHIIAPDETPMTNLMVSMLRRVGVEVEKLGDSTGQLRELF